MVIDNEDGTVNEEEMPMSTETESGAVALNEATTSNTAIRRNLRSDSVDNIGRVAANPTPIIRSLRRSSRSRRTRYNSDDTEDAEHHYQSPTLEISIAKELQVIMERDMEAITDEEYSEASDTWTTKVAVNGNINTDDHNLSNTNDNVVRVETDSVVDGIGHHNVQVDEMVPKPPILSLSDAS